MYFKDGSYMNDALIKSLTNAKSQIERPEITPYPTTNVKNMSKFVENAQSSNKNN